MIRTANALILFLLTFVLLSDQVKGGEIRSIEFTQSYKAERQDIKDIESLTGKKLPQWYVEHYLNLAGLKRAELKDYEIEDDTHVDFVAVFEDGGSDGDHIVDFLTVEQIKQAWPYIDYLEEDVEHFEISSDFLQWKYLFPLAGTGDGTLYVAIGGDHDRAVYEGDNGDYGIGRVANDIDDFIGSLGITIISE